MKWFSGIVGAMRQRTLTRKVDRLQAELANVSAELEAERRRSRVKDAELESLAAVIARDRERVRAETAQAARRVAEAEGEQES